MGVCNDVSTPREVCNDVPDEVCRSVPATVTKYVDEENCSSATGRKCAPATRQECENVKENVARQTFEERCNTEYVAVHPVSQQWIQLKILCIYLVYDLTDVNRLDRSKK